MSESKRVDPLAATLAESATAIRRSGRSVSSIEEAARPGPNSAEGDKARETSANAPEVTPVATARRATTTSTPRDRTGRKQLNVEISGEARSHLEKLLTAAPTLTRTVLFEHLILHYGGAAAREIAQAALERLDAS